MEPLTRAPYEPLRETPIAAALERLDGDAIPCAGTRWSYRACQASETRTTIAGDGDWVRVECTLGGYALGRGASDLERIWTLLDPPGQSPLGARPVLPVGATELKIRAELPLSRPYRGDPERLAQWIQAASAAVSGWAPRRRGGEMGLAAPPSAGALEIKAACELAGWSAAARGVSGAVVVALPSRHGGVCHAVATPEADAVRFRVAVESAEAAEITPGCQLAAAVALLRLAGGVRLVRATASGASGHIAAALEVTLPPPLDTELLRHALPALATAHRQIAAELGLLAGDNAVAQAYLVHQGLG